MKDYAILISMLAFLVSFGGVIYNYRLAKTNVLHSIQKMMLDKAKDCNGIYQRQLKEANEPDAVFSFDIGGTLFEIITSMELLNNSLNEYNQMKKRNFFLKQFWIQIDPDIRYFIGIKDDYTGLNAVSRENITEIRKTFIPLFTYPPSNAQK